MAWRDLGPTPELIERARLYAATPTKWTRRDPRLPLVYGGLLVEAGDLETAEHLVREFAGRQPPEALARCLPLARFARDIGVLTPELERAAETADVLAQALQVDALRSLTAARSVAVVGNGASPLGHGLGAEIDGHDVVIRFNNFPAGFEPDLGSRTDVWVRGAHRDVIDRFAIEPFQLVVWEMDLFRNLLEHPSHAGILHRDTRFAPQKTTFFDTATKRSLREASGLRLPSSGAQLLWALHQARGSLEGVSTYGFSTIEGTSAHGHFFDSLGDLGARHDVAGEGEFLQRLLAGDHANGATRGSVVRAAAVPPTASSTTLVQRVEHRRDGAPLTIVSCAFREYDPASGKTGGPAGVLATQQRALGAKHHGYHLEYVFRDRSAGALRGKLSVETTGLSTKTAEIIIGAEYLRSAAPVIRARTEGRRLAFACHELGSAYGAYLLGAPYVIVYHGQGSTLQELRSIGRTPTDHESAVAARLERLVCENASAIYFPSLGARDTFLATSGLDPTTLPLASDALYNTVSAADHDAIGVDAAAVAALAKALHLPPRSPDTDVFVSVGDYNHDKGLDRIPALLNRYVDITGRHVLWIAVGRAADPELFRSLQASRADWRFSARLIGERMDHDSLLALLEYGDYYLMLHRAAIFDLATLEAMRAGIPLVLSPVGGNQEVAVNDNVVFVDADNLDAACREIAARDRARWGKRNREAFDEHFSLDHFADRYRSALDRLTDNLTSR